MTKFSKVSLLLLRFGLGWVFLYAGLTKVLNPSWTAAGYLKAAKTFPELYQWFASTANIDWVNFLNKWGLTLVGAALILGIAVRIASWAGTSIMLLYYLPALTFPKIGANSYLVDEHIVYALVFLLFSAMGSGATWGLYGWLKNWNLFKKWPWLDKFLG